MLQQSDVEGRLRLFRYGVIVIVVVTFVVTLIAPYSFITSYLRPAIDSGLTSPSMMDFVGQALIGTLVAAVIGALAYLAYHYTLTKKFPWQS
jgi:hypothetical protein